MKMHLRIKNGDGSTADVVVSAVDLVAFEERYNRSVAKFQDEFRITDLYWLAWHSLRRFNKSMPEFDAWLETADPEVMFGDETDGVIPLESNPLRGE